jgi:hypothetical protein
VFNSMGNKALSFSLNCTSLDLTATFDNVGCVQRFYRERGWGGRERLAKWEKKIV